MEFPAPAAPFVVALLVGTVKKPKLTNVTTGMFTGSSMIFHAQEGEKYVEHEGEMKPVGLYHEYVRHNVNKTSINLRCSKSECFKIGSVNEHNVVGQFEKRIAEDMAGLDEEDELHFEDELI